MLLKSYSKINLFLNVNNKIKNGLHEIQSYFCLINLSDKIKINLIKKKKDKIMFVVANVNINYKKAGRFNDELDIETSIDKIGASRVDLTQNIMKNSDIYTSAKVSIACIHPETFKPQRIPKLIKQQMEIL